jgi:RHS repeat-associated protein
MGIAAQQDPDTTWYWPLTNGLGSVRQVMDSGLDVIHSQHFAPYGEVWGASGTAPTDFGFTGEPVDPNGLVHLRARYYDPGLGVFPSLDPAEGGLQDVLGLNRYGYVQGNVPNIVDSSGMIGERPPISCGPAQTPSPSCQQYRRGEVQKINTSLENDWGVTLTVDCCVDPSVTWTAAQIDNLVSAFRSVEDKLRVETGHRFKSVFGGLEIRHVNSNSSATCKTQDNKYKSNSGAFRGTKAFAVWEEFSGYRMDVGPTGRDNGIQRALTYGPNDPGGDYGLVYTDNQNVQDTVIHELGHALDHRTKGSLAANVRAFNLQPTYASGQIATKQHTRSNYDSPREISADHFLNFIGGTYLVDVSPSGCDANDTSPSCRHSAYWFGDLAWQKSGGVYVQSPGIAGWTLMAINDPIREFISGRK